VGASERFTVHVPEEILRDLRQRLEATRWSDTIPGSGWDHGTDVQYLRELVTYWLHDFDWRAQEQWLDEVLPGWTVDIDGRVVHYARIDGRGPSPLPLLLLHGWPGSYFELSKVAPMLADPGAHGGDPADAFDVIVPSLPGHGFSAAPTTAGFGADECADVMRRLMVDHLGYQRFVAQGGDRGAFVSTGLAHRHRDVVAAIHLNFAAGIPGRDGDTSEAEERWLDEQRAWAAEEGGYIAIQGTKPQTLAFALHDSPVGMLAWIVEKWRTWSDCDGDVESCFTKDELLINATIYWVTGTIRSSMHYYWEHRHNPPAAVRPVRIECPTAVAMFPREVMRVPRSAAERKYDLRRWTEFPRGGHFAAMEQPEALVADIRAFFRDFRDYRDIR
jgi:pimeloyl-ACP methyl ester carboxylesterase